MGCLLLVQALIDILPRFLQWYMQYVDILNRVITALYSMYINIDFIFVCKWNTFEWITLIYICHRCCNNDSRPDTAPGGGGKWASPNLQVWKKLATSIWKQTLLGMNKWPTCSRWHFQMKFPQWKCFYIDSNFTEIWGFHLNKSTLVQV